MDSLAFTTVPQCLLNVFLGLLIGCKVLVNGFLLACWTNLPWQCSHLWGWKQVSGLQNIGATVLLFLKQELTNDAWRGSKACVRIHYKINTGDYFKLLHWQQWETLVLQGAHRKSASQRQNLPPISSGTVEKSQQPWTTVSFSQATEDNFSFFPPRDIGYYWCLQTVFRENRGQKQNSFHNILIKGRDASHLFLSYFRPPASFLAWDDSYYKSYKNTHTDFSESTFLPFSDRKKQTNQ